MKTLLIALIFTTMAILGCGSAEKTSKKDTQVLSEARAKADAETKKMEEEKAAKEQEEKKAREELEKKKAESDKNREELGAVKERLKKMGLATVFVPVSRDGQIFMYPGGRTTTIKYQVSDMILLRSLNQMMDSQLEKSNSDRDYYNTGNGGFEACLNDQLYILYMYRNNSGAIVREWFEMMEKCN
jgi:flagellar biosynthesis GTPase FlhF